MRPVSLVGHGLYESATRRDEVAPRPIAVLLAIPHRLDRELFHSLLTIRPGFVVGTMVGTRAELEAASCGPKPDVVLLELTGPGAAGRLRVADVRHHFPGVPVLATSPHDEDECPMLHLARQRAEMGQIGGASPMPDCLAVAVIQGAHGAIRRTGSIEEFCSALRLVAQGATWFDKGLSEQLVQWAHLARSKPARPLLSPREIDVARQIVRGHSNKEIASQLGLSEPTVKKHVGHLMEKLELSDRLQLGLFFARHRFLLEKNIHHMSFSET